uniref:beta-fructofuranosidase n=1 Tax=Leersia perrieri TaxID=77586 RepID=A0A0D9VGN6_9ORYZ
MANVLYGVNIAFHKNKSEPQLREWIKPSYNPVVSPELRMNLFQFHDPTTTCVPIPEPRLQEMGLSQTPDPLSIDRDVGVPRLFPSQRASVEWPQHIRYVPDNPNDDYKHLCYDNGIFYAPNTFFDHVKQRHILLNVAHDKAKGWASIYTIPRMTWLDLNGKQLLQWPIEELETPMGECVDVYVKVIKPGEHLEVTDLQTYQADMKVSFEVSELEKEESRSNDTRKLCGHKSAVVKRGGGMGPFGLWIWSSTGLDGKTTIFFIFFRDGYNNLIVLICANHIKCSNISIFLFSLSLLHINIVFPKNKSEPLLREWIKPSYNLVVSPELGMNPFQFHDPTTTYVPIPKPGLQDMSLSQTPDPLCIDKDVRVPRLFPSQRASNGLNTLEFNLKYVLKNSLTSTFYDYYTVGTYKEVTKQYVLDNPNDTFLDPVKQHRILLRWVNESDSVAHDKANGWASIYMAWIVSTSGNSKEYMA